MGAGPVAAAGWAEAAVSGTGSAGLGHLAFPITAGGTDTTISRAARAVFVDGAMTIATHRGAGAAIARTGVASLCRVAAAVPADGEAGAAVFGAETTGLSALAAAIAAD